jgi:hypothetical protein
MSLEFPASPTVGDTYTVGARTWTWSGTIWEITGTVAAAGSIGTTELADSSITTAKIAAGAVAEADIADGAVTSAKIAAGAVVEADIASNAVTAGKLGTDVQLGYRNVIINGAMQVAQRGTSTASITTAAYYTADRFLFEPSSMGTWTQSIENDAPTGSGFRKSLKLLCTTADASPSANDYILFGQRFEGQNLQQFLKGTSSAKSFTLSFWVKSNATGTYNVELLDNDNTRVVSASYTIDTSATWEKKTITFPADTTGAFDNDNASSMQFSWWLGAGTTFTSGTRDTVWGTVVNADRAVGQTNLAAATNNYWQITGVQLEAGAVATPFEFEDISTTLAKCQRYYQRVTSESVFGRVASGQAYSTSAVMAMLPLRTTMRTTPTSIDVASLSILDGVSAAFTIFVLSIDTGATNRDVIGLNATTSGLTQFRPYQIGGSNTSSGFVGISAEL